MSGTADGEGESRGGSGVGATRPRRLRQSIGGRGRINSLSSGRCERVHQMILLLLLNEFLYRRRDISHVGFDHAIHRSVTRIIYKLED